LREYVLKDIKELSASFNLIVGIKNEKNKFKNTFSELEKYKQKIYYSKDNIEIYDYEKPIIKGYHTKGRTQHFNIKEVIIDNRKKVTTRIRNRVRRLTKENFDENSRFITLTFPENIQDIKMANYEFLKFIKRLRYKYGEFRYLAVIEFQERGAIHYHMLADFGYIKQQEIFEIWGHGWVWIKDLLTAKNGKPCDNVAAYLIKYINKDLFDKRLMGQQAYLRSRNLKEPTVVYENLSQDELFKKYGLKVDFKDLTSLLDWGKKQNYFYFNSFMTKENGKCEYMEFNKKRMPLKNN
jgi:hypothetical protein